MEHERRITNFRKDRLRDRGAEGTQYILCLVLKGTKVCYIHTTQRQEGTERENIIGTSATSLSHTKKYVPSKHNNRNERDGGENIRHLGER